MDILDQFDTIIADMEKDIIHLKNLLNDPEVITVLINNPSVLTNLKKSIQNLSNA